MPSKIWIVSINNWGNSDLTAFVSEAKAREFIRSLGAVVEEPESGDFEESSYFVLEDGAGVTIEEADFLDE